MATDIGTLLYTLTEQLAGEGFKLTHLESDYATSAVNGVHESGVRFRIPINPYESTGDLYAHLHDSIVATFKAKVVKDTEPAIDPLFEVHMLNDQGKLRATAIAHAFTELLLSLGANSGVLGREGAIVKTKLEEAAFFAKRSMASQPENQETK